ncbi:hypothetical protein WOLCODRAFT_139618, partial [Wolfiporia cocos MD-104 SS10]
MDIAAALVEAEQECKRVQVMIQEVDYEAHRKELERDLQLARDEDASIETRQAAAHHIDAGVKDWLPSLWRLGVEKGREIPLVHKCLLTCLDMTSRAAHVTQSKKTKFCIRDTKGNVVFDDEWCRISNAIHWVWGELVLAYRATRGDTDGFAKRMVADLEKHYIHLDVDKILGRSGEHPQPEHWTPAMKAALQETRALFASSRLQSFKLSPSPQEYERLVKQCPTLSPVLIDIVRRKVQANRRARTASIPWKFAADIFIAANRNEDLLAMDDIMPRLGLESSEDVLAARLAIARYLRTHNDEELCSAGLRIAEDGLSREVQFAWVEVEQAFPGWDDAWDWLARKVRRGHVERTMPLYATPEERHARQAALGDFAAMLCGGGGAKGENGKTWPEFCGRKRPRLGADLPIDGAVQGMRSWVELIATWPSLDVREAKRRIAQLVRSAINVHSDECEMIADLSVTKALIAACRQDEIAASIQMVNDLLNGQTSIKEEKEEPAPVNPVEPVKKKRVRNRGKVDIEQEV